MSLGLTIPLLKVDQERRLVVARAAATEPDRSGEIMDWETAKPEFLRWSNSFAEATGGLSKGNVRLQHDPKQIAGKVVDLEIDEDAKAVNVVCKVVDDRAWKLCLEGCVTGISIGGSYASKWRDPASGLTKYTPRITEISLVDNPCIPSARIIELHKANGMVDQLVLTGRPRSFADVLADTPSDFLEALAKAEASEPVDFWGALAKRTAGTPLSEAEFEQRRAAAKKRSEDAVRQGGALAAVPVTIAGAWLGSAAGGALGRGAAKVHEGMRLKADHHTKKVVQAAQQAKILSAKIRYAQGKMPTSPSRGVTPYRGDQADIVPKGIAALQRARESVIDRGATHLKQARRGGWMEKPLRITARGAGLAGLVAGAALAGGAVNRSIERRVQDRQKQVDERWDREREKMFGKLAKASGKQHAREWSGAYADNRGERWGATGVGAAAGLAGLGLGIMRGKQIGARAGHYAGMAWQKVHPKSHSLAGHSRLTRTAENIGGRFGPAIGAAAGTAAGIAAGGVAGRKMDEMGRVRRAKRAYGDMVRDGRLTQEQADAKLKTYREGNAKHGNFHRARADGAKWLTTKAKQAYSISQEV